MTRPFNLKRGPDYPTSLRIGSAEVAEGSVQQAWCEQRARLPPSDGNRESVGYAEDSHHSTDQLEQRVRLPHFHANRSSIDLAEGSNQKGRPPVQYSEIPIAIQTQLVQDRSPLESYCQPSDAIEAMANQKKGVLDKRDFRKSSDYQYTDDSTFQLEQGQITPLRFESGQCRGCGRFSTTGLV